MIALGQRLAAACDSPCIIYLDGPLGAGKTTLVRGVLSGLGYHGTVRSPTYTLVEPYTVDARRVFHFDLFRLTDVEELEFVGVRDYFDGDATCLVEWPERGEGLLPPADLVIHLRFDGSARRVILESRSPRGDRFVKLAE